MSSAKLLHGATTLEYQNRYCTKKGKRSEGLILHLDQKSQFASKAFAAYYQSKGIIQSMSKAGCTYDNASIERFYNTYKNELIYQYHFIDDESLNQATEEFVYTW
jgi:transposase InsO family protein